MICTCGLPMQLVGYRPIAHGVVQGWSCACGRRGTMTLHTPAWVYIRDERPMGYKGPWDSAWTVGFFDPQGKWQPDSDHDAPEKAAARVHYLNGGKP